MSDLPLTIRAAQMAALVMGGLCAGTVITASAAVIPTMLNTHPPQALLLRQWKHFFDIAKLLSPGTGIVTALTYVYLAFNVPAAARAYAAAAGLSIATMPFTVFFIFPTNNALDGALHAAEAKKSGKGSAEGAVSDEEARRLVAKWGALNWVRALLPIMGVVVGAWATAELM